MKYGKNRKKKSLFLCIFIAASLIGNKEIKTEAASKMITLKQAQNLALAADKNYQRTYNKIELKKVKYVAAIKSIEMKKKNMRTFRWTPLLSFKFPEQPKLADEYEWQYKPVQIQSEITGLEHKLTDCKYAALESVSLLYTQAFVCQEKIEYLEDIIEASEKDLKRIQAKAATGKAKQADADKLRQSIHKKKSDMVLQMRTFLIKKEKLSDKIKTDIKSGYRFENPLVDANIPRTALPEIIEHTLENDQAFYETKLNEAISFTSLQMTESFMKNQYGGKMGGIQLYVNQVRNREDVNLISFKKSYDQFLRDIDAPWDGYFRILFIKINKEWFKGAISGSRYVEDDPYALYSASLDYQDARDEKEAVQKELKNRVNDQYESLITAQNAYLTAKAANIDLEKEIARALEQNRMGILPYNELKELQEEYEKAKMDEMNMLDTYSQLLYSFNRLTCGAINKYLKGIGIQWKDSSGGDSYVTADEIEGAYYYIETKIEDRVFILGVQIPEDFSPLITHFELWVNNILIGQKTPVDKNLRHLALDFEFAETVEIRLYDEDKLIEICEIDSDVNRAPLLIRDNYRVKEDKKDMRKVASYTWSMDSAKGLVTLSFQKETEDDIVFYSISNKDGQPIYQKDPILFSEKYTYLSVLANDLSKVTITFYNAEKKKLYTGTFDTLTGSIYIEGNESTGGNEGRE